MSKAAESDKILGFVRIKCASDSVLLQTYFEHIAVR